MKASQPSWRLALVRELNFISPLHGHFLALLAGLDLARIRLLIFPALVGRFARLNAITSKIPALPADMLGSQ